MKISEAEFEKFLACNESTPWYRDVRRRVIPENANTWVKLIFASPAILNSRQTKTVNYQRVLVLQAESAKIDLDQVTKGRIGITRPCLLKAEEEVKPKITKPCFV